MSSSLESTYRQNISTPVKQTVSDRVSQKGTPTVEQVLNEAEVVLDLILKSTSDPLHKRAKKRRAELDARNQATVRPQKLNYGQYIKLTLTFNLEKCAIIIEDFVIFF